MHALLREMGHEVEYATSGQAAMACARKLRATIVFADLGLPDMEGYRLCKAVVADDPPRRRVDFASLEDFLALRQARRIVELGLFLDEHDAVAHGGDEVGLLGGRGRNVLDADVPMLEQRLGERPGVARLLGVQRARRRPALAL